MTIPTIRYRKIDCGIGKQVPISIVSEILMKRATHVSLHANNIHSLDISCKNSKNEEIRTGCLKHLIELDLSSNCLHEGYSLPQPHLRVPKMSLLGLCSNLLTLNLASNGLNEHSFSNMNGGCSDGEVEASGLLPRLHSLDISHNHFTILPRQLHKLCPSLKHLVAVNNKIKLLKTLLQELHSFRGKLESFQLIDDTATSSTTNIVCLKELYREKVIFLLGDQFIRLDGGKISNNSRENARLKLEHELSINPGYTADETKENASTLLASGERGRMEQHIKVESIGHIEVEGKETQEKIKFLEEQVASLSATIACTEKCENSRCRNNGGPVPASDEAKQSKVNKPDAQILVMRQRERAAACFLFAVVSRRRNIAPLRIAFSLWLASTRFDRHANLSKLQLSKCERKWTQQTKELIDQAVRDETEKCRRELDYFRGIIQASEDRMKQLTREVEDLEERLQNEKRHQQKCEADFNETSSVMKSDLHRLEVKLKQQISENKDNSRQSENELNRLHDELQSLSETLGEERRYKSKVEFENKELKVAYNEMISRLTKDEALLNQLQLEVVSKEEIIKSVKDAYEHAPKRSAVDRLRCEQAVAAEQNAKDLLLRQTTAMQDMQAEARRYIADHQSRYSSKESALIREVEEKDERLRASEMRIKSILKEQDDLRTQLLECKKLKSQTEEKNMFLEAQLNRAADDISKVKECSIDKEQFDEAKSRIKDLKHSLDELRRSSQQREQTLVTKNREAAAEHERMAKSLSRKLQLSKREWMARVEQLESMHRFEIQEVNDNNQRELASRVDKFQAERKARMELEDKVAKLQSEIAMQKLKMQTAIDSMVNKLSEA